MTALGKTRKKQRRTQHHLITSSFVYRENHEKNTGKRMQLMFNEND